MTDTVHTRGAVGARASSTGFIHVLQVAASLAPRDGGPATGITALNAALRQRGLNALVLATDADGNRARLDVTVDRPVDRSGARVVFSSRSRPYRLKNSWAQARQIWVLSKRTQVLHVHGIYLAHSVWTYLAARHR